MKKTLWMLAATMTAASSGSAFAEPVADSPAQAVLKAVLDSAAADNPGQAPEYPVFADLAGIQRLKTGGVRYTFGALAGGGFGFSLTAAEPFHDGVRATLDTATGAVTYQTADGVQATFTAADEVPGQSAPLARLFSQANPAGGVFGGSLTTPVVNRVPLSYTRFGTFFTAGPGQPLDGHAFVFGVATLARDLPKTGSATYTSAVGGTAFAAGSPGPLRLIGSTATFSANFATGAIATDLKLIGTPIAGGAPIALDTLAGLGSISGAKPGFSGSFTGTGTVAGSFSGGFFGPNAVEFGYDFLVGGTNAGGRQFTAIGGVAGSTAIAPPPPPPA